jgi:hypothetical protein
MLNVARNFLSDFGDFVILTNFIFCRGRDLDLRSGRDLDLCRGRDRDLCSGRDLDLCSGRDLDLCCDRDLFIYFYNIIIFINLNKLFTTV